MGSGSHPAEEDFQSVDHPDGHEDPLQDRAPHGGTPSCGGVSRGGVPPTAASPGESHRGEHTFLSGSPGSPARLWCDEGARTKKRSWDRSFRRGTWKKWLSFSTTRSGYPILYPIEGKGGSTLFLPCLRSHSSTITSNCSEAPFKLGGRLGSYVLCFLMLLPMGYIASAIWGRWSKVEEPAAPNDPIQTEGVRYPSPHYQTKRNPKKRWWVWYDRCSMQR